MRNETIKGANISKLSKHKTVTSFMFVDDDNRYLLTKSRCILNCFFQVFVVFSFFPKLYTVGSFSFGEIDIWLRLKMFNKLIILTFISFIVTSNADDDCSDYFRYNVVNKEETQGLVSLNPKDVREHRLKVKLMVKGQITTVSGD